MNILNETKMIMKKYGLDFKKKFGQNFLISEEILDDIVVMADITEDDIILEIGPGVGTLTAKMVNNAKHVVSVEIDDDLISPIKDRFFMYNNFTLIHDDILKINIAEELEKIFVKYDMEKEKRKVKVVANIPYYITTPILLELIARRDIVSEIYIMVQKEFSERVRAKLGTRDASSITYYTSYYAEVIDILEVKKDNFLPAPKVDSEVLGLRLRKSPEIDVDVKEYFKLINAAFLHRRKTFLNSVKLSGLFDINKISVILEKLNIDLKIRPEKLTDNDYANIINAYKER